MDKSGFFNSFHRNSHGELKSTFFDPFEVKHRKRTSKSQLKILEKTFETNKKPDSALRNQLSEQLGMTPRSVQVWFQNRRAKQKKAKNKLKYPNQENLSNQNDSFKIERHNQIHESPEDSLMFQPIQIKEQNTMFCNDRYPISPLQEHHFKDFPNQFNEKRAKNEEMLNQEENFPEVEGLDASWVDMRKQFDHDESISENTICFDPNNFFCE